MCGIVGGYTPRVAEGLKALHHRGPDFQDTATIGKIYFGHTRLAILDLDARSNQPFKYRDLTLIFNGEIWNYNEIKATLKTLGHNFTTDGDTEVLAIALYEWGSDAIDKLNGMFAFAWTQDGETLYLARDRYGEIPIHIAKQEPFVFASEVKALKAIGAHPKSLDMLKPGHYAIVTSKSIQQVCYYDIPITSRDVDLKSASHELRSRIEVGAQDRSISDVPVCTLLSGGVDSAVIAYHLKRYIPNIVAYTAVFNPNSQDARCARLIADKLEIPLVEVKIPLPTAQDLSRVIETIEMDYKAQVEIGWACLILAQQMQDDGFKVTFSGEGSDELWASYGFAYHGLKTKGWHEYRKDLFLSQARKNFVRCNKVFMAHSIECRLPFLSPSLVEYAISLPRDAVQDGKSKPKAVLQQGYIDDLPDIITRRAKVAFQDGLGLKDAIAKSVLSSPKRFYSAEYKKYYEETLNETTLD